MKLMFDKNNPKSFRFCCCCHVKTGTVCLGLWQLIMEILLIGVLILISFHPDILKPNRSLSFGDDIVVSETGNEHNIQAYSHFIKKPFTKDDQCVAYIIAFASVVMTVALIYGVIKRRPGYLMPFFCLQVFDFCISCLTIVGYFTYAPNIKVWLTQQGLADLPGMDKIMTWDCDWLMLLFVAVLIVALCLKAYFISMVWACFKYLQMENENRSVVRHYNADGDAEMLLPPKYEDAIKMPIDANSANPPPPYELSHAPN